MSYDTPPPIEIERQSPKAIKATINAPEGDASAMCRPESGSSGRTPLTDLPQHADKRPEVAQAYAEAYRSYFRLWRKWGF